VNNIGEFGEDYVNNQKGAFNVQIEKVHIK